MERNDKPRDVTLSLGDDVVAALDEHRAEIERRSPGLRPSRSAVARTLLLRALEQLGHTA